MRTGKVLPAIVLVLLAGALAIIIWFRVSDASLAESLPTDSPEQQPTEEIVPPIVSGSPTPSPETEDEAYSDKPEVDITSWELRLVNQDNPLFADFAPELTSLGNGQYFDSRAAEALQAFAEAARAEGLSVYITSSYRSYSTQQTLFDKKVNEYLSSAGSYDAAVEIARTIVAYPGTSEHQTALAADIVDKYYEYMNESLADTQLSKWMKENCADFGFILRFPEDKQDITGIMFEPWHFRYVGVEAAQYIMDNGLCLEEFVALY